MRRYGAATLDLAWVACGRLDAYWERDLSPWDLAAGSLLVREAGGFVSDCDGKGDIFKTGDVVAGNDTMHRELLRLLKEAGKRSRQGRDQGSVGAVSGAPAFSLRAYAAARRGCRDRAVAQNLAGGLSAIRFRRAAFLVARALAQRDHGRGQDRGRREADDLPR